MLQSPRFHTIHCTNLHSSAGAFFTTYEGTKSFLNTHNPTSNGSPLIPKPLVHASASALAELVSCAILTPAEVIKQNAQMISAPPKSSSTSSHPSGKPAPITASATAQALARFRHNPTALWRGYTALAGRNLPFTAMQFPMFEHLKSYLLDRRRRRLHLGGGDPEKKMPLWESGSITALAAGSAGAVAAVITTPVDVIKTRIMLAAGDEGKKGKSNTNGSGGSETGKPPPPSKRKSGMAVAREIVRDQGWKGLWRGGALRGVWTMLGSGLYLGVYESGRLYLEHGRAGGDDE